MPNISAFSLYKIRVGYMDGIQGCQMFIFFNLLLKKSSDDILKMKTRNQFSFRRQMACCWGGGGFLSWSVSTGLDQTCTIYI